MVRKKGQNIAVVGLLAVFALTNEAQALPMFTTQTGMDCTGCHTQIMPRLNKFGRKFAASGMTISKQVEDMNKDHAEDQSNITDMDINPSILIKSKYARTWDKPDGKGDIKEDDTNDGEYSPVRMATFYYGGRINENVGGILNLGWRKEEGRSISGKVVYSQEVEDGYWGTAFYSTATLGPFSGMEFYNTGLYKPLRTFDNKVYSNSAQSTKAYTKAATGLQLYYDRDNLFDGGDHFFITCCIYWAGSLIHVENIILSFFLKILLICSYPFLLYILKFYFDKEIYNLKEILSLRFFLKEKMIINKYEEDII